MALVTDMYDSQGMFSKAGRFTSEKYIIFQKKDEILHNKVRYARGTALSEDRNQQEGTKPQNNHQAGQNERDNPPKKDKNDPSHVQSQPFSKQTNRDKLAKLRQDKNQPPPCGYYHPKYVEIDTKPLLVFDYAKAEKQTLPRPTPVKHSQDDNQISQKPIPDKLRKTQTCLYELSRQLPRGESLFKSTPEPHEKRFEFLQLKDVWSKIPRTPSVPMSKILSRDQMIIYKRKNYAPDYQPNFEFGKRGLGSCGAKFEKGEKRKDIFFKKVPYTNETYFEYDHYAHSPTSQIFQVPQVPDFKRMLDREQDQSCKLPSFMQKFVNMRMTLQVPHQKMLEVNNFKDGRFMTMTSTFGSKFKRKQKRNPSFSNDEIEVDLNENGQ